MVFNESDRLGVRAKVPPEQKNCPSSISSIYENSFSVKAAKLWNILPKSVDTAKDLDSLKVAHGKLGKFLERFQDTPPTPSHAAFLTSTLTSENYSFLSSATINIDQY